MLRSLPLLCVASAFALSMPALGFAEDSDAGGQSWEQPGDNPDHDDHDGWGDSDHDWLDDPDHDCADHEPADAANPQQKLAAKFGVDEAEIASLRGENLGYGEIDHTLTLAERMPGGITDENVGQVLEMRQDQHMGWGQIAKSQGTTLGNAKREFPVQEPVAEPLPADSTQVATASQPKSLSRPGKSAYAKANGASAGSRSVKSGKSSLSRGGSNRSGQAVSASSSSARSGHAYGHGSSAGASAKANGNGKAKGQK